ncbi:MAG TPA: type II toxin-antitoxin system Phd/YefM family antitoxin [Thermoflexia bacterium]|jgi:prevent-host-death family protein|nr:type II toxin-antitoxin system Phd/YefM family antitoxin [Thermoflexia bacterium]
MPEVYVSIGRVKRDISELVNRVAYGGERIVLTSRGKPKAALISIEDYERLRHSQAEKQAARWQAWVAQADALAAEIQARRGGALVDVDALLRQEREELEGRSDWVASGR